MILNIWFLPDWGVRHQAKTMTTASAEALAKAEQLIHIVRVSGAGFYFFGLKITGILHIMFGILSPCL
jgi:hypothetical protein